MGGVHTSSELRFKVESSRLFHLTGSDTHPNEMKPAFKVDVSSLLCLSVSFRFSLLSFLRLEGALRLVSCLLVIHMLVY